MSYNIDSVDTPVLNASMDAHDIIRIVDEHEDQLPECCFVQELYGQAVKLVGTRTVCGPCRAKNDRDAEFCKKCGTKLERPTTPMSVELENLWWYGEGSGNRHEFLVKVVAPLIKGEVEAIFTWEGGDSVSGLAIKDGKVIECEVEQRLVKPEGW